MYAVWKWWICVRKYQVEYIRYVVLKYRISTAKLKLNEYIIYPASGMDMWYVVWKCRSFSGWRLVVCSANNLINTWGINTLSGTRALKDSTIFGTEIAHSVRSPGLIGGCFPCEAPHGTLMLSEAKADIKNSIDYELLDDQPMIWFAGHSSA